MKKFTFIKFSTPKYPCNYCPKKHGGSMSDHVCPDCWSKGYR